MMQVSGLSGQAGLLRAVHAQPGITRVSAAQELEMPSGFAAETSARLAALELLIEHPAPPTGRRGRPTTSLHPHPCGPLVAVADIAHESWRVAAAVPGTVVGGRLVQAPNLGWNDVDLSMLWPRYDPQCPFLTGNDATFAAIAESRRGAAAGAGPILHLYMDAGVGGAVIEGGRALLGATGMAGEFGHMPFGDPTLRCRCGAAGCWNTTLDGHAVARALRQPAPADEVTYTRRIIAAAKAHQPEELSAIQAAARSLGRGAAGLANAFDPHIVTVGGLGRDLLSVAGEQASRAYLEGLMQFRTSPPPPMIPAHFGDDAPLVGAAEDAFSAAITDQGLRAWSARTRRGVG